MTDHCCSRMRKALAHGCPDHSDPFDCPDALVHFSEQRGYGLIVHDGGSSVVGIDFCPWCGAKVSKMRR